MYTHRLIGSLTSPYVRKVRIELALKGIAYDFVLDDVWSADPSVLTVNPLGQVPCLILPDTTALTDSRSIIEYLDLLVPYPVRTRNEQIEMIKWQALAEGVMDTAVKYRVEQLRPEALQSGDWFARQKGKLDRSLSVFETRLREHTWLAHEDFSRADVVLQCALNFIDFRIQDWAWRAEFEYLSRFERTVRSRPEFAATMPRL